MLEKIKRILKISGYTVLGLFVFLVIVGSFIPESEEGLVVEEEGQEMVFEENIESVPVSQISQETISQTQDNIENISNTNTDIQTNSQTSYLVTKVVDGDTITISKDGSSATLRLIGIDTPETVHPSKPVECFGAEASNKAKSLLSGKYITLETDDSQGTYDRYQRMLAYVYLPDGTMFNKYMISEGYAYEYTYGTPYKYQNEFKQAENSAKQNKKGFWADGVCEEEAPAPVQTTTQTTTNSSSNSINTGNYSCSSDTYNCGDFATQSEAQNVFDVCGGVSNDIHRLDADGDGIACETLP